MQLLPLYHVRGYRRQAARPTSAGWRDRDGMGSSRERGVHLAELTRPHSSFTPSQCPGIIHHSAFYIHCGLT